MKRLIFSLLLVCASIVVGHAQTPLKKVYDETINPMEQIDRALATARSSQQPKLVICQVGGNLVLRGACALPTSPPPTPTLPRSSTTISSSSTSTTIRARPRTRAPRP